MLCKSNLDIIMKAHLTSMCLKKVLEKLGVAFDIESKSINVSLVIEFKLLMTKLVGFAENCGIKLNQTRLES